MADCGGGWHCHVTWTTPDARHRHRCEALATHTGPCHCALCGVYLELHPVPLGVEEAERMREERSPRLLGLDDSWAVESDDERDAPMQADNPVPYPADEEDWPL